MAHSRRLAEILMAERCMSYVITDPQFRIIRRGGQLNVGPGGDHAARHTHLNQLFPETAGLEGVLRTVLSGELPRYRLDLVNRDTLDGGISYLDLSILPWREAEGRITGLVLLVEDATHRGTREQRIVQQHNELHVLRDRLARQNLELSDANAELTRLDDLKSLFVSVAAHELRSPLASMLAYLEILLEGDFGDLSGDQRDALAVVQSSADRLLTITSNLLDVTRIESGHLELVLQPTDLAEVLHTVVAEFRMRVAARAQRLTVICGSGLPRVLCDPARTHQIVTNLLDNAHKYTPDGGRIEICLDHAPEDGFLRVSVTDNGIGHPLAGPTAVVHPVLPGGAGDGTWCERRRSGPLYHALAGRTPRGAHLVRECTGQRQHVSRLAAGGRRR